MPSFRLTESDVGPGCREIRVEGELDLAVAPQLEDAISRGDGELIAIDLAACEFIDSTGIAMIVRAHRETVSNDRRIVVHSPSEQVLRVLTITGLMTTDGLVFENRDEALSQERRPR